MHSFHNNSNALTTKDMSVTKLMKNNNNGLKYSNKLSELEGGCGKHATTTVTVPFAHDIAVEGVEDALVGQLQRLVKNLHVLATLDLSCIAIVLGCGQLLLPNLRGDRGTQRNHSHQRTPN